MKFPPTYVITETIERLLRELDVLKAAFTYIPVEPSRFTRIRQESVLKSALYSARIEGNPLSLDDARMQVGSDRQDVHLREVENINNALGFIESDHETPMSVELLSRFHAKVLDGISANAGRMRTEESAIYNAAGIAVYLTPAPATIRALLEELCAFASTNASPPVTAAVSHIWFEKIHPFLDGNGRVGRLLSQYILVRNGYGFTGIVPFEEYLDTNRQAYYDALGPDRSDVTAFVEFFCTALVTQTKHTMETLKQAHLPDAAGDLPPRRSELVSVIREHRIVSFDFLARRFRAIPARTLHYDLKQLAKAGFIKKLGATRGVQYVPGEKR